MLLQLYDDVNQLKERLRERTRELNNVKPQLERKDAEIQFIGTTIHPGKSCTER